jgi:osmotically inducible protein OsmC
MTTMKVDRHAEAEWLGGIREGSGSVSTDSGVLKNATYGFKSRFESGPGTNPEELLAAAHAGCFSMAVSGALTQANTPPERIHTTATITLEKQESGFVITKSALVLHAKVPGIDKEKFEQVANGAKANCPVSRLFKAEITLEINLES